MLSNYRVFLPLMKILALLFNVYVRLEFRGFVLFAASPWQETCKSLARAALSPKSVCAKGPGF